MNGLRSLCECLPRDDVSLRRLAFEAVVTRLRAAPSLHTGLITSSAPLEGPASLLQGPQERFQHAPSQRGEPGSLSAERWDEAVCRHRRKEPRRLRPGKPRTLLGQTFPYSLQGTSLSPCP